MMFGDGEDDELTEQKSVQDFLQSAPDVLDSFSFIILSLPAPPGIQAAVSAHAAAARKPAFFIHSTGLYASLSIQLPDPFSVSDAHPDPASTSDLRLLEPWPELEALAARETSTLDTLSDEDHGHVPYVLLLLHYLSEWRAQHNGANPTSYADKRTFRDVVRNGTRLNTPGGPEENFDEAAGAVLKVISPHAPSSSVRSVLDAPEAQSPTRASSSFWLLAHAVRAFAASNNGSLPLSGALPDMKATSAGYVALQNTYRAKALADRSSVTSIVRSVESSLGRATPISDADIAAFCRNAGHVRLLRGRAPPAPSADGRPVLFGRDAARRLAGTLWDERSGVPVYMALLAREGLYSSSSSSGSTSTSATAATNGDADADADTRLSTAALAQLSSLLQEAEHEYATQQPSDNLELAALQERTARSAREIARGMPGETHGVAAAMGGVAAQEAIKAITGQYVPVNGVVVWDGVGSGVGVLEV